MTDKIKNRFFQRSPTGSGYSSIDWGNIQQQLAQVLTGQTAMNINETASAQDN